jgi:uncharacterized protein (TIGR00730 family)
MSHPTPRSTRDPFLIEQIDALVAAVGSDPQGFEGQLVREMVQTCLRLVRDGADTGELKLIGRSLKELRYALKVFRPYADVRKISIFGSARTPMDHPHYLAAVQFSRLISQAGWMVITGAGDGIMKAGHGGAGRDASFGVAIRLPFETNANDIIVGDDKLITFRYFFTRKLLFVKEAQAVALFPGGFGTHDEGFEVLTLIQTGKAPLVPIVMVDAPGGDYWTQWNRYVHEHLLAAKLISPQDLALYHVTDDPADAARHVLNFYRNYHSQRYVGDEQVFRLHRALTDAQLDTLNEEFADLIVEGRMKQSPAALAGEDDHPSLPRLHWLYTKRDYGRLRQLIDRINAMDQATHGDIPPA